MLKSQRTKSKKLFRKRNIFFPAILVLGAIILIFNDMGIITWHHMRQNRQNIQEEIERLIIEEKRLTEELTRLKYDDDYIKKIARERFHMVKPGEKVFRVVLWSDVLGEMVTERRRLSVGSSTPRTRGRKIRGIVL